MAGWKEIVADFIGSKLKNGKVTLGSIFTYKNRVELADLAPDDLISKYHLASSDGGGSGGGGGTAIDIPAETVLLVRDEDSAFTYRLAYDADYASTFGANPITWVEIVQQEASGDNAETEIREPVAMPVQRIIIDGVFLYLDVLLPYDDDQKTTDHYYLKIR